jgi:hypothetical protein
LQARFSQADDYPEAIVSKSPLADFLAHLPEGTPVLTWGSELISYGCGVPEPNSAGSSNGPVFEISWAADSCLLTAQTLQQKVGEGGAKLSAGFRGFPPLARKEHYSGRGLGNRCRWKNCRERAIVDAVADDAANAEKLRSVSCRT